MIHKSRQNQGISIAELIMFILIASIAYIALMQIFTFAAEKSAQSEVRTNIVTLLVKQMETIRSKRFDEKINPSWTATASLGPDAGETSTSLYDDCDDYAGLVETNIPGFASYTRYTRVFYVNPSVSSNDSVGNVSYVKRIIVKVSQPDYGSLSLTSILSSRTGYTTFQ